MSFKIPKDQTWKPQPESCCLLIWSMQCCRHKLNAMPNKEDYVGQKLGEYLENFLTNSESACQYLGGQ